MAPIQKSNNEIQKMPRLHSHKLQDAEGAIYVPRVHFRLQQEDIVNRAQLLIQGGLHFQLNSAGGLVGWTTLEQMKFLIMVLP